MTPVQKVAVTIPVSFEMLLDDPCFVARNPWLLPDPNPFPRFRLFTLRRKAKR